jgi:cation transport regulator
MPYSALMELPKSIRDHLPKHAQEIYKDAFNSAWEDYNHDESRAHRVAWGAVKKQYHKNEATGDWEEGAAETDA